MDSYTFLYDINKFSKELSNYSSLNSLLEIRGNDGLAVLHYIFISNNEDIIDYVLQNCSIEYLNSIISLSNIIVCKHGKYPMPGGRNILHFAVQFSSDNIVEKLINIGIKDEPDYFGYRPSDLETKNTELPTDKEMCEVIENEQLMLDQKRYIQIAPLIESDQVLASNIKTSLVKSDNLELQYQTSDYDYLIIKNTFENHLSTDMKRLYNSVLEKADIYKLKAANSMNKYGFNYKYTPFDKIVKYFVSFCKDNQLHKKIGFQNCDYENFNAFLIGYKFDKFKSLNWHRDNSCWTFAICLYNDVYSSNLTIEYVDIKGELVYQNISIQSREAIVFPGTRLHKANNVFSKKNQMRVNLIIWFKDAD